MGIGNRIRHFFLVTFRIKIFRNLSDCAHVSGQPRLFHPMLLKGRGKISFGRNVQIGVIASPNYYSHYAYLEARNPDSVIVIGDNVSINNAFSASAITKISIGDNVLIGINCNLIDTDAHPLDPQFRHTGEPHSAPIHIGNNVFLGDNVTVLKGVTIGENSVIGAGSVVATSIPENVVAAGNPAKVIRTL
ncbi:Transferase [Flavobacterium longum]|uniref:DapH/DapD/GlmU-related protein n=1 Tax=Flavobacterium longum TaxID=1299340 RepID=UPI0039EB7DFC